LTNELNKQFGDQRYWNLSNASASEPVVLMYGVNDQGTAQNELSLDLSKASLYAPGKKLEELTTEEVVAAMQTEVNDQIVLANAVSDRHPDHGRAAELVSRACFLSGLPKIITENQVAHRPKAVYHYIQDRGMKADVIVDITSVYEQKMQAIKAFKTQFYDPNSKEPETPISSKEFLDFIEARALEYGRVIGTKYGEGFTTERTLGTNSLIPLL
jgi:bacillithiol biosynthesis deacetylase BshB1